MAYRSLAGILIGLLTFAVGAIIMGVQFLEGLGGPPIVLVLAATGVLLGLRLVLASRHAAQVHARIVLTTAGLLFYGALVLALFSLIAFAVLGVSPKDRLGFLSSVLLSLVLAATIVVVILERRGIAVVKEKKRDG